MNAVRVQQTIETDGELHLENLPCRRGDRVEVIVLLPEVTEELKREKARARLIERSKQSQFRSVGSYPTREELHDRT